MVRERLDLALRRGGPRKSRLLLSSPLVSGESAATTCLLAPSSARQPAGVVNYAWRFIALRVPAPFAWSITNITVAYCIAQRCPRTPAAIAFSVQATLLVLLPLFIHGLGLGTRSNGDSASCWRGPATP